MASDELLAYAASWRDMVPHVHTLIEYARKSLTIIELGVRGAVSSWAFLEGLPPSGELWSVDIEPAKAPDKVLNDPRWHFQQADDTDFKVWYRLPPKADIVFIDTSHEYEHTELELLLALSRNPTWIICHDAKWPGVERAVTEFCPTHGWKIERLDVAGDGQGDFSLVVLERA